jgi:hypothetical protein
MDNKMSDRFRELAEEFIAENALARYSGDDGHRQWWNGGTWLYPERAILEVDRADIESALRKLADEIREEDARICHQEAAAAIAGCQSRHHQFIAEGCEECAEAIRAKKTKPPSEIEP